MKRLAIITALLVLLPATAQANTAEENQDLAVASAYFQAPCPDVQIRYTTFADGRGGQAQLGACQTAPVIELSSAYSWSQEVRCILIVHEYGHLLGMEHSADTASIMYPQPASVVPGCRVPAHTLNRCKSKSYKRNHRNKCRKHTESEGV